MTPHDRAARDLISRHLQGRVLPEDVRTAIERAVSDQLNEGLTAEMDIALRHLIDHYATSELKTAANRSASTTDATDDHPATVTDVYWRSGG